MTEKTKKIALITICCLLCAAVAIGIATRFGGNAEVPSGSVSDTQQDGNDPTVDINDNQTGGTPSAQPNLNIRPQKPDDTDPGQGAVSTGTDQTIQADPVKPEAPEKPEAPTGPATTLPDDHKAEDVPQEERKTEDEEPPAYEEQPTVKPEPNEPAAGSTNSSGQVYVPGFGYIDQGGENTKIEDDSMYENGNKIGVMGGN